MNDKSDYDVLTDRLFYDFASKITKYDNMTAERVYPTTNELVDKYIKLFDINGKRVATVGSSGDQLFYSLLGGAKDVTVIDANPYTRAFIEYKMAAIATLDASEFVDIIKSPKFFNWKVYSKFSQYLSPGVRQFWDTLMLEQESSDEYRDVFDENKLARNLTHNNQEVYNGGFYQDEEEYNRLQEILRSGEYNIDFITSDIYDFPQNLKGKYDLIMLSNIFDYNRVGDCGKKFEETISKIYKNKLKNGGTIQVAYSHRDFWYGTDPLEIAGHKLKIERLHAVKQDHIVSFIEKPLANEKNNEK